MEEVEAKGGVEIIAGNKLYAGLMGDVLNCGLVFE